MHVMASLFRGHHNGSGHDRPGLPCSNGPAIFADYRLGLPPLPEQRAIAAMLDSIDEAIERTEAVIDATERLRESLLHELLTRGVPGWHSEWKEVRGIGTIPADWDVVRLGDVAAIATQDSAIQETRDFRSFFSSLLTISNLLLAG